MSFQYPVMNKADQISAGAFSLSCHQLTITLSSSEVIIDALSEVGGG